MPEILSNRNSKICDRLERPWCGECAKIGSTDCIDHGGHLSEDTSVLGKRLGHDAFGDFRREFEFGGMWDKNPLKPQTKRPNAASSNPFSDREAFLRLPTPELIVRPASSGLAIPPPTKFAIKPIPSVPIKPTASVPANVPAVAVPSTESAVVDNDPSTPSDLAREQGPVDPDTDENGCKEGGVRFRENLGKFVVEYRPPRFKWKLWMGTYATVEEGRRACDCARFYAGQDKGGFYFKDSPALFGDLGPLNRPFSVVSKDVKDKAFNVELKKRAKQVIKKVLDAQRVKQSVDVTRPTVKKPLPDAIVQGLQVLTARTNGRSDRLSSSSQESLPNSAVVDSGHEENELAESVQHEVASGALDACVPHTNLDHYTNLGPLSETSAFDPEFAPTSVLVSSFMLTSDHHDLPGCLQSSLDFAEDFDDYELSYVKLWNHDELP
ncbi:hypothetical protein KC19_4G067600 [Ceratodon purpureus]|uniref:AP2/ERF domain-containing protein n=1 Tax=Ceratodon purpureus TaxID=3225 RepID=A0A8T0I7U9_CERPU|nr:hypothetical protein KC19_4G067600 [Ceratodon purpureus]